MILDKFVQTKEKLPMLNFLYQKSRNVFAQEYYQIHKKIRFKHLYIRSPEAQSVIDGHARDICDDYHFEPLQKNASGRNKIQRAKNFALKTQYRDKRFSWVKDALITGEGFMFISELTKEYAKVVSGEFKKIDPSFDENFFRIRGVMPVASTTMAINHDDYAVTGYTQTHYNNIGGTSTETKFKQDQVMHLAFDKSAGDVQGWTPMFSLPLHLELLWLMWVNQYDFQEKGNHPDLIVMAERLQSNKLAYDKVRQDLESYNMPGNSKHGTLLLSGDKFSIQQLERMDTLQFKETGMFIQSLIASAFHYPQSRLSIKTEQSAKSKDSSGSVEKFYYRTVCQKQQLLTDLENRMLWMPYFGVEIVQNRSFMHDEVEEGTAQQIRLGNLNTTMQMFNAMGYVVDKQKVMDIYNGVDVNLEEEDIVKGALIGQVSSTMNDRVSNDDASKNGMAKSDRIEKREEENNRIKADGKPNGITR